MQRFLERANLKFNQDLESAKQNQAMADEIEKEKIAQQESIIQEAITSILNLTDDYSLPTIEDVVRKLSSNYGTPKDLTRETWKQLKKIKTEKRKSKKKISTIDMFNDIMNN